LLLYGPLKNSNGPLQQRAVLSFYIVTGEI
jgi:hypothetical protein